MSTVQNHQSDRLDVEPVEPVEFHGVNGDRLTACFDFGVVIVRGDFPSTELDARGARALAAHLSGLADHAEAWERAASDLGPVEPGSVEPRGRHHGRQQ